MRNANLYLAIGIVCLCLLISAPLVNAQNTLSITFTKTQTERAGSVDYSVKWTDANEKKNSGYYYVVNSESTFTITKRNAQPQPQLTVKECRVTLDASNQYYIHIAPVDTRGAIMKTESFKLF